MVHNLGILFDTKQMKNCSQSRCLDIFNPLGNLIVFQCKNKILYDTSVPKMIVIREVIHGGYTEVSLRGHGMEAELLQLFKVFICTVKQQIGMWFEIIGEWQPSGKGTYLVCCGEPR